MICLPTVKQKIISVLNEFFSDGTTQEKLYLKVLEKFSDTKMTTFTRVLYELKKKGVVSRTDNGLYVLGEYRAKRLDWLPDL